MDPECRDRGSSDNPKFIVKRELKRYPAGKVKTGAGRRSWQRHRRMLQSGGYPLARNWLPAKRSHNVRNNKDQVIGVSEVDLHSSAKVPNETE